MLHTQLTLSTIDIVVLLLLAATLVAMLARRVAVPYTVALVVCGLLIGQFKLLPQFNAIELNQDLILKIFLPALLFEGAFQLNLEALRDSIRPIAILALPGVLLSTIVTAVIIHVGVGLPLLVALIFGSIVSATDPVAVLAAFRHLGVSERLTTIVEGESLFNDGTALVLFTTLSSMLVGTPHPFIVIGNFLITMTGGAAVGLTLGYLFSRLTSMVDDHLIEMMMSTVLAYGAYLVAELLGVSGVIAVVLAGLVLGNYGRATGMSANTERLLTDLWGYVAFVANSLLFLLIGVKITSATLVTFAPDIGWAVLATIVGRAIVIYGTSPLIQLADRRIPLAQQHVLFWGGLRGALSIAAVLSLPTSLPEQTRTLLQALTFGVVLFTLLAQGLFIGPLVQWLGLSKQTSSA